MRNHFYKIALTQAMRLAGKPGKMLQLVAQLLHRLYHMDRDQISVAGIKERLQTLGRLVASYARGHYREVPFKTLLKVIAALVYFLNPIDLVPDAIIGIGLVDDLAVLTWVYSSVKEEVNKFVMWETSHN